MGKNQPGDKEAEISKRKKVTTMKVEARKGSIDLVCIARKEAKQKILFGIDLV